MIDCKFSKVKKAFRSLQSGRSIKLILSPMKRKAAEEIKRTVIQVTSQTYFPATHPTNMVVVEKWIKMLIVCIHMLIKENKENILISLKLLESEFNHPFSVVYIVLQKLDQSGAVNLNVKYFFFLVAPNIGNYSDYSLLKCAFNCHILKNCYLYAIISYTGIFTF